MRQASQEYGYNLNYGEIEKLWCGGCIIRARFLNDIQAAFVRNPDLPNLMIDPEFAQALNVHQSACARLWHWPQRTASQHWCLALRWHISMPIAAPARLPI